MINADHYLAWIKSVIALCSVVTRLTIIREENQFDKGLWRYRLSLTNKSFLEMFEFFSIESGQINVVKYSYSVFGIHLGQNRDDKQGRVGILLSLMVSQSAVTNWES